MGSFSVCCGFSWYGVVSFLDFASSLIEVCVCSLNPLRRWGIALRYEPTGEEHASSLIATADPAVAPTLAWGMYDMLLFCRVQV